MAKESQCDRVVEHIKKYGSITTQEAIDSFGCTRLASRITDLKRKGYIFKKEFVPVLNRFGEKTNVMRYSILEEPKQCG